MENILDTLVKAVRRRIEEQKKQVPLEEIKRLAAQVERPRFLMEQVLRSPGMHFICEVKKASPSKGLIAPEFPYVEIAKEYERAGADCLSVLTETDYFLGSDDYFREIRQQTNLPMLRKDFTVDEYMIYQAKAMGADGVLLICAILSEKELKDDLALCEQLGLSALVETHSEQEVQMAARAGARILGVNNRDLTTFQVDLSTSRRLRKLVPEEMIFVAESGIQTAADVQKLREAGVNGVLIGETLMRSPDKGAMLAKLAGCKVKICGLKTEEDVRMVNRFRPAYAGFVFAGEKRRVTDAQAGRLRECLLPEIKSVGVFVNEPTEHILTLCKEGVIDLIQLHGEETEEEVQMLQKRSKKPVIRAVRVRGVEDILQAAKSAADYLLFDTYKEGVPGGSGKQFCWKWLQEAGEILAKEGKKMPEFFLAGGLTAKNVSRAAALRPFALDISSGVETDGHKDETKLEALFEAISQ